MMISFRFYSLAVTQRKRVVVQNNQGEKLVGILHETGSEELVIVCHGFRSSKVGFAIYLEFCLCFPFFSFFFFVYKGASCICFYYSPYRLLLGFGAISLLEIYILVGFMDR